MGARGNPVQVGRALLFGGIGYVLTVGYGWPVVWALCDVLPQPVILTGVICVALPLWPVYSLATWWFVFGAPRARWRVARLEDFERREALTESEFARLFPAGSVATAIRAELRNFIGRVDVADRLLPSDPVLATCALVGLYPFDIHWANFLCGLEEQFGTRIPDEALADATVSELVGWCAGPSKPTEPGAAPDPAA